MHSADNLFILYVYGTGIWGIKIKLFGKHFSFTPDKMDELVSTPNAEYHPIDFTASLIWRLWKAEPHIWIGRGCFCHLINGCNLRSEFAGHTADWDKLSMKCIQIIMIKMITVMTGFYQAKPRLFYNHSMWL